MVFDRKQQLDICPAVLASGGQRIRMGPASDNKLDAPGNASGSLQMRPTGLQLVKLVKMVSRLKALAH